MLERYMQFRTHLRIVVGSHLVVLATVSIAGTLFLWQWSLEAGEHRDIVARGPFILALYMPYIVLGAVGLATGLVVLLMRRNRIGWLDSFVLPLLGGASAVAVHFLDPTGTLFGAMRTIQRSFGPNGLVVAYGAVLLVGVGLIAAGRATRKNGKQQSLASAPQ